MPETHNIDVGREAVLLKIRWLEIETKRLEDRNRGLRARIAGLRTEIDGLRGLAARLRGERGGGVHDDA